MGNDESHGQFIPNTNYNANPQCPLKIRLDKEMYFQEETITGHIWLEFAYPVVLSDIRLNFVLNEYWLIKESEENVLTNKHEVILLSSFLNIKSFFNLNSPLINLLPGQYTFPITISIPKDIQPSFEYSHKNRQYNVRYSLIADTISDYAKYQAVCNVIIKSRPKVLNLPLMYSSCVNVHSWSFFNQGSVVMNVSYPTNNYKMGDEIPLKIFIDNTRGNMKTHSVIVYLIRKIKCSNTNQTKTYEYEHKFYEKTYPIVVDPRNKHTMDIKIIFQDKDDKGANYNLKVNPYPFLKDFSFLMPSVSGFTVVCEYCIRVTLYFAKFVTNYYRPRVVLPVTISHQLAEEYSLEQMEKDELEKALIISQIEANEKEEMKARINMFGNDNGNNNVIRNDNDDDAAAPVGPMMMYNQQQEQQQHELPPLNYSVPLPNSNNLPTDVEIQNNLIQSQVGNNNHHGVNISEYNQNGDGMVQEELEKNFYPQIEMNNNNNNNYNNNNNNANNNRNNRNYLDINQM